MRAVVDALQERYRIVAILTLFHGTRLGEVPALRRECIHDDGESITVEVNATMYRRPGVGMVLQPGAKTEAGNRHVPVFPQFNEAIREHMRRWVGGPHSLGMHHTYGPGADGYVVSVAVGGGEAACWGDV